ncbi:MAG TPA: glycosyltransferase family 4 protein [Caulobacteraceae bacterium]|jgi:glycosyltransferase involved in cell wall biosynthesis|nr:glycosyltransferase family 4 protein [Caulobacteraceae bacterium]
MRILFVTMHRPRRSPGQRFRFEQYIPYLRDNGFDCDFSYLISEADDRVLYASGRYAAKFGILMKSVAVRLRDVLAAGRYDIIFVFREALMINTAIIERLLAASRAKLVFDFDDAIWLQGVSEANGILAFLRGGRSKVPQILRRSDMVFVGNRYLAEYAAAYNDNVHVIPTTLDTASHAPRAHPPRDRVCIGWSGSPSTVPYFDALTPALARLKQRFGDRIYFKVMGDASYENPALDVKGLAWREAAEVEDTAELDIGLMPLPDDPWTRGKCGFKALLYMSLAIAPVVSPVGVNADIVEEGVNGFSATTDDEWVAKLSTLVEDAGLREQFGKRGRETVVERFSFDSQKDRYVQLLRSMA